jgi:uncharacterized LabA/DUF88 family protein
MRKNKEYAIPNTRHRDQRIAVFIDVQNIFYSARKIYEAKVHFGKLLDFITSKRKLLRAIAYIVQKEGVDQSGFVEALQRFGYEVRSKVLKIRPDGTAKGDWDMGIAIDSVALADKLDTVVLVSGDGDFVPLVEMLKARGCRVEVMAFERSTAAELKAAATFYRPIEEGLLFKKKGERGHEQEQGDQ